MSKQIELDKIRLDGGTQMRDEIDYHTVDDYSHAYASGVDMPELTVFCDGSNNWLGDGFHRWHAAKKAGKKTVPCHVKQGSQRDAILFAAGANDTNGLRRTQKDKMIAVRRLLLDDEWGKKADRWIAKHANVSHPFVGEQRKQLPTLPGGNITTCKDGVIEKRKGQDGKTYTRRKPSVPAHVPPIDADEPPAKSESKPVTVTKISAPKFRAFDNERNLVRGLADLVTLIKQTHYEADFDKGRLAHDLNTWANDISDAMEAAEAVV